MFNELLENETVASVNVDTTQTDKLLHLLDTVVIKLEGGTDEDLKVLDEKPVEIRPMDAVYNAKATFNQTAAVTAPIPATPATSAPQKKASEEEENWDEEDNEVVTKKNPFSQNPEEKQAETNEVKSTNPFARKHDDDDVAVAKSDHSDDEESKDASTKASDTKDDTNEETVAKATNKRKRSQSESSSSSSSSSDSDDDTAKHEEPKDVEEKQADGDDIEKDTEEKPVGEDDGNKNADDESSKVHNDTKEEGDTKIEAPVEMETIDLVKEADEKPKLRALHRTSSVFLRNLAPTITKAEVNI